MPSSVLKTTPSCARQAQVAPGLAERVPVDGQARVGGGQQGHKLHGQSPQQRRQQAGHSHRAGAHAGQRDQHATHQIADQDGHKGAHFHQAVAARELALLEHLRQQGVFERAKHGGMQAHEKGAGQQQRGLQVGCGQQKASRRHRHDGQLQVFDRPHHAAFFKLVGQLATGG
jgi:hypothetical protein